MAVEKRPAHAFGTIRGRCIFCGVHRDDPRAAEPCQSTATPAGVIALADEAD